jgi:hypothetical protein
MRSLATSFHPRPLNSTLPILAFPSGAALRLP